MAPQLIVLRIVSGTAWTRQSVTQIEAGTLYTDKDSLEDAKNGGSGTEVYGTGVTVATLQSAA